MEMINGVPRRNRIDLNTPAELAINNAIQEVEKCGASESLTKAVTLLADAKNALADHIEGIPYHAEKQRTDDRDIKQAITQMKEAAENNRVGWNFPNEHYIEYTAIIMTCDDLLEFLSGQMPAKEN